MSSARSFAWSIEKTSTSRVSIFREPRQSRPTRLCSDQLEPCHHVASGRGFCRAWFQCAQSLVPVSSIAHEEDGDSRGRECRFAAIKRQGGRNRPDMDPIYE